MTTREAQRIVTASAVITLLIGIANNIYKKSGKDQLKSVTTGAGLLPSTRFFVGVGVVYFTLSILAEKQPDIANAFAIAIATGVVLGGGPDAGWLSYLQGENKELTPPQKETRRREPESGQSQPTRGRKLYPVSPELSPVASVLPPYPGIPPTAFDRRR